MGRLGLSALLLGSEPGEAGFRQRSEKGRCGLGWRLWGKQAVLCVCAEFAVMEGHARFPWWSPVAAVMFVFCEAVVSHRRTPGLMVAPGSLEESCDFFTLSSKLSFNNSKLLTSVFLPAAGETSYPGHVPLGCLGSL